MAYMNNIVVNPSAETGDTTGWVVNDVTVVAGTTVLVELQVRIGDTFARLWGGWWEDYIPHLYFVGVDDTNYFLLAPGAAMEQPILSGFETDFKDGKLLCNFKFVVAQNLWDATIIGRACADIVYDDETTSKFIIPCVQGLTYEGRDLPNGWIQEVAVCL